MMNNIPGQTGATDAVTSSKSAIAGRRGGDEGGSGFSDALSEIHRDGSRNADGDVADDQQDALSDATLNDDGTVQAKTKPIIDISKHSLRRAIDPAQQDVETMAAAAADPKTAKSTTQAATEKQLTPSEKKLRDALVAAKAITEKLDLLHGQKSAAPGAEKAAKADGDELADDLDELDIDALLANDGGDAQLSDVLSLLSAQSTKSAVDTGHAQKAMPAASGKRAQNTESVSAAGTNKVEESIKELDSKTTGLGTAESAKGEAEPAANDRVFRFTNDKARGQSMDMTVGESGADRKAEFKSSGNGAAENVTVLDSRRFIGLAPNSNSAALTSALSGDKEWVSAMQPSSSLSNEAAQSSTGSVVNTLKLQMNPHDLGSVTAMLRLRGDELNVHLTVETRAAYRQLSEDSSSILDALRSQGLTVDQVTISIAPTADTDTSSNSQNGQGGGQAAANDEKQGNAAGRGQGQSASGGDAKEATRNGNDAASDNEANSAAGGAGAGQLYL